MADPLHQFVVTPIVPLNIGGVDISFTNSSLWMIIAVLASSVFLSLAMRRASLVPGRMQVAAEMLYEFIANMIRTNIGPEGRQYFPLIFTLFIVVLMGNLLGMLPYSFTYTSHIAVTAGLAVAIFLLVVGLAFYRHGVHFLSLFAPPGLPFILYPLIVPLELISYFVRPITLSVRLFANMMAGHLMLKVFAGFSVAMLALGVPGFFAALLPMMFNVLLIGFEVMIALLHAYVFSVLCCIYLKDTVDLHH
ncbi:MAG: F0F1 ATP synthase subunit A [Alphaproteobacteria bacterium]|nr:F0F1 ATP synthase subunit A [Alphaproteobacteria bacterium]MBU0858824.1 F0F1 ATP synthase subunit A [Alphaproteobacteria bacterium]